MTLEQFAELSALTSETVEVRLHNTRSLLVKRQFGPVFGGVDPLVEPREIS
jgi:hypothetical protein